MLDVDGVLVLSLSGGIGGTGTGYHRPRVGGHSLPFRADDGVLARVAILTTVFQPAWATSWEDAANEWISPWLGLPTNMPVAHRDWMEDSKVPGILTLAAGRDLVWIDDHMTAGDRRALRSGRGPGQRVLALRTESHLGLMDREVDAALAFVARDQT